MDTSPSIEEGNQITVAIRRQGDSWVSTEDEVSCNVILDDSPANTQDSEVTVSGTVTKTIYTAQNTLDMIFLATEPEDEKRVQNTSGSTSKREDHDDSSSPSKSASYRSSTKSSPRQSNHPNNATKKNQDASLEKIAEELIGNKKLEVTEDKESTIEKAKRQAKNQQRDPAIDPKFDDK